MLNCSVIMGRLTANPELKHTQSDLAVTSFTVAVERSYATQGEERQADFIDVTAWRSTAEFICKYFSKGQMIVVQGMLQTRNYTDSKGNKRKAVEIVANHVYFGDSKKDTEKNSKETQTEPTSMNKFEDIFSDDDLPF